ncbi:hypothetical protein ACKXTV_002192, partial [Neisseria gonorrhoeae]
RPSGICSRHSRAGGSPDLRTTAIFKDYLKVRESRPVGAETYREKRFLEILRLGFPLLWE